MASWRVYVRRVPQWVRLLLLVPLFYGVWLVSLTGEGGGRDSDSLASLGGGGGGHGGQRKPLGAYATGHDDTSVPRVTKRKLPLVEALEMTEVRKSPPLMCPVINPAPFDGLVQMNPAFIIIGGQKCGTTSMYNYLMSHPNVLGLIPPECTNTHTASLLRAGPRVIGNKEIRFFDNEAVQHKNLSDYLHFFPKVPGEVAQFRISGESTPNYIYNPKAAANIRSFFPPGQSIKLIAVLRDPVDRAQSHYYHATIPGMSNISLADAVTIEMDVLRNCETERRSGNRIDEHNCHSQGGIAGMARRRETAQGQSNNLPGLLGRNRGQERPPMPAGAIGDPNSLGQKTKRKSPWIMQLLHRGIYVDQIRAYLELYSRDELLIIKSEDMYNNEAAVMARVAAFIGLPSINWDDIVAFKYNFGKRNMVEKDPTSAKRHDEMTPELRHTLQQFFKPYNQELYDLFKEYDVPFEPWSY